MGTSVTLLLTTSVLTSIILGQTPPPEKLRTVHECLETVGYSYSNPIVTGKSKPSITYYNDNFKHKLLGLSCVDVNLYVDILSIKLSLPQMDAEYCKESKEGAFPECSSSSHCLCCRTAAQLCSKTVALTKNNFEACHQKQKCNVTVVSEFLSDCPGREYTCDSKKCHSRWADVEYYCRQLDRVQMTRPLTTASLSWWQIVLIVCGCLLLVGTALSCYRKCRADALEYTISGGTNNNEMNGKTAEEIEIDDKERGQTRRENDTERKTNVQLTAEDLALYTPSLSQSSTLRSQSSGRRLKAMGCRPPPPPPHPPSSVAHHHH